MAGMSGMEGMDMAPAGRGIDPSAEQNESARLASGAAIASATMGQTGSAATGMNHGSMAGMDHSAMGHGAMGATDQGGQAMAGNDISGMDMGSMNMRYFSKTGQGSVRERVCQYV